MIYYPAGKAYTEDQLHENTVKFGNYSFVKHTKLDRIVIPAQIVELGTWVFYSTPITEAIIHANVQSIGNNCFAWCDILNSADVRTVNITGTQVFTNCTRLTSVSLAEGTTTIPGNTFNGCSKLPEFEIPESVTAIGASAFTNCSKLTELTIPENVKSVGSECFFGCRLLGDLTFLPVAAPSMGLNAFGKTSASYTGASAASKNLWIKSNATGYSGSEWDVLKDTIGFTFNKSL